MSVSSFTAWLQTYLPSLSSHLSPPIIHSTYILTFHEWSSVRHSAEGQKREPLSSGNSQVSLGAERKGAQPGQTPGMLEDH